MISDSKFMGYNKKNGFSLVEIVVYVGLLGMAAVFMVNSFIQIANVNARARAEREVLANARATLQSVTDAIASARAVYSPTSRFNSDAGQLSLATTATFAPGETGAYVDFWVDGGRIFERIEGQGNIALSAATVRVSEFRVERIMQSLGREAVKATIRVDAASVKFPASVTLNATTALRGNY
ncbi:MAG: type II secretion system protein [Candidatus Sungiibacteriota bacterium]